MERERESERKEIRRDRCVLKNCVVKIRIGLKTLIKCVRTTIHLSFNIFNMLEMFYGYYKIIIVLFSHITNFL